jgi:L-amino acid N-acyltransferase YncA
MTLEPVTAAAWPEMLAIYKEGMATGVGTFETGSPSWDGAWHDAVLFERRSATIGDD